MNEQAPQRHEYGFLAGLVMGGVVGAGLAIWLAPRAADSVRTLGKAVSDRYRDAGRRVTEALDGLIRKGQGLRDDVCDTVVRAAQNVERGAQDVERGAQDVEHGAQDVQQYATDAKTHA